MFLLRLSWRDFTGDKLLWGLSAAAVALGVAVVISGDIVKSALLRALISSEDAQMMWAGMTDQLNSNLTAIGLAITLAAGFIVFNAFGILVARRRRRLATLRAVGMTRSQVLRLALIETFLIGGFGVVLGLVAGPILGRLTITAITSVTRRVCSSSSRAHRPRRALWAAGYAGPCSGLQERAAYWWPTTSSAPGAG